MMVNEEDHIRLQAITGGWAVEKARVAAQEVLLRLKPASNSPMRRRLGTLSSSAHNCGPGRRVSAMFHFIGLAQARQTLPAVLLAVAEKGLAARGLFEGEASREPISKPSSRSNIVHDSFADFVGACDYLIREEREVRQHIYLELRLRDARSKP